MFRMEYKERTMECTVKILRERKQYGRFTGERSSTIVQIYCPILGEIVLSGEQAEKAIKNIREMDREEPPLS